MCIHVCVNLLAIVANLLRLVLCQYGREREGGECGKV